jgi:hypothetical protein
VVGYGLGRLWVESLRIDFATTVLGFRVNTWISLVAIAGGLLWLFWGGSPVDHDATRRQRAGEDPLAGVAARRRPGAAAPGGAPSAPGSDAQPESEPEPEPQPGSRPTQSEPDGVGPQDER